MEPRSRDEDLRKQEPQWIQQALLGDTEAFVELIELYQRSVFNLCYRMLGTLEDAEDAAQETFLRAFHSLRQYDPARPFATWLLSIAAHYCIDQIRKRRMVIFSLEDLPEPEFASHDPPLETTVGIREDQQKIQQLLKTLSEVDRAVVVLYYWYDLSYEEIAKTLSLSVSAIKSRLHRARRALANSWLKRYPATFQEADRKGYESPVF
ncbi:MAG: sigma-70 family RNA polymerase sigma factor [Anaerolineales bacterium]|nr:sigma-70 family RNA polymerase sigma factor [Anaerolineales bacterium]MCS7246628.1 sigma-70 family RNA polymerase sigma factor [Anaerolineales bacterium]MDW8160438.1 sigma-70 family RNA polymerase sigma factor [Anaerolineales bacterium]MDW8447779.1 sigma-70 family RNA polymerase sigma factor [Anaerolineales bacterium]